MGVGMAVGDDAERQFRKRLKTIGNQFRARDGFNALMAGNGRGMEMSSHPTPEGIFTFPSLLCVRMHFMHLFWELESFRPFPF